MLIPSTSKLIQLALDITGYRYLTVENIASFFLHPITIVLLLLLCLFVAFFSMMDVSAIIYNTDMSYQDKTTNMVEMIRFGLQNALRVFSRKNILMSVFMIVILPFLSVGVAWSYFRMISLSDILLGMIRRKWQYSAIFLLVILICAVFFIRWVYSFHYFTIERNTFFRACFRSSHLNYKRRLKDTLYLILIQVIAGLLFVILFGLGIGVILLITHFFAQGTLFETVSMSVILTYLNILYLLLLVLITPIGIVCISSMFYRHKKTQGEAIRHCRQVVIKEKEKTSQYEKRLHVSLWILVFSIGFLFYPLLQAGALGLRVEYARNVAVTAHRGASADYPENSMSAIKGATELGADWIEIDVQQTKDGQIIVMHDTNLKRTTGNDVNIWNVTYEQLQDMEIGSWFSTEFAGEPIPLLSEVLEFAKENHVRLNIELKPTGHEEDFEKSVIDLIREYGLEDQCVVTSQVYEVLQNVKKYDPEIHTVYVMSVAYGNILRLKAADSFSIKYTFVTDQLVTKVHNAGKEIYAWTMNSEYLLNEMIELNVDNVVTDDVVLAQKCIYTSKSSNIVIRFVKKLLGIQIAGF